MYSGPLLTKFIKMQASSVGFRLQPFLSWRRPLRDAKAKLANYCKIAATSTTRCGTTTTTASSPSQFHLVNAKGYIAHPVYVSVTSEHRKHYWDNEGDTRANFLTDLLGSLWAA